MIRYLRGLVIDKAIEEQFILLDVQGVGYRVFVSKQEIFGVQMGENVAVHTHYAVKEDSVRLYGFLEKEQLSLFELLISVSKIGPRNALNILDTFSNRALIQAIQTEDYKELSKANGIGLKTAQRIVLELKDKCKNMQGIQVSNVSVKSFDMNKEAVLGLSALGFTEAEAIQAMENISSENMTSEELIKEALKNLYRR